MTALFKNSLIQRTLFWLATTLVLIFFLFPLYWLVISSFKVRGDVTLTPPTLLPFVQFQPTLDNYYDILTTTKGNDTVASPFIGALLNSILISGSATIVAVVFGTLAAYAFSRFRIPSEGNLMFLILSTRMLPPVVVIIPIFLMFSGLQLRNTFWGLTILYITAGLPFVVWMMKGFFDEIPREYEEAAMMDGYSRLEAIYKIVIPEAIPAMLATAVFVLITAWNEFIFALRLNPDIFSTVPPYFVAVIGYGHPEWERMAAQTVVFLLPVLILTVLVRNHLLRGVTFGALRR